MKLLIVKPQAQTIPTSTPKPTLTFFQQHYYAPSHYPQPCIVTLTDTFQSSMVIIFLFGGPVFWISSNITLILPIYLRTNSCIPHYFLFFPPKGSFPSLSLSSLSLGCFLFIISNFLVLLFYILQIGDHLVFVPSLLVYFLHIQIIFYFQLACSNLNNFIVQWHFLVFHLYTTHMSIIYLSRHSH